jgi:hypothetical protein
MADVLRAACCDSTSEAAEGQADAHDTRAYAPPHVAQPPQYALTPACAVAALMTFVVRATAEQRAVLEDPHRLSSGDTALAERLAALPGKLDHAAAVAYRAA